MPLWQGFRGVDGNFGGSGLQPDHVFLRTRRYSAGTLSLAALYSATNSAFASGRQFVQASMILRQPAVFSGIYVAIGGNSDVGR